MPISLLHVLLYLEMKKRKGCNIVPFNMLHWGELESVYEPDFQVWFLIYLTYKEAKGSLLYLQVLVDMDQD